MSDWMQYKEEQLQSQQKMDAVNLQGVWLNFPQQEAPAAGGGVWVAGRIIQELMRQEEEIYRRRRDRLNQRVETEQEKRKRILEAVEKKLFVRELDNWTAIFAGI